MTSPILTVRDRSIDVVSGKLRRRIVDRVSFELFEGESLGIVGESGAGKTALSRSIFGLVPPTFDVTGEARFLGDPQPLGMHRSKVLGHEAMYLVQQAMSAFDPLVRLGSQLDESALVAMPRSGKPERAEAVDAALEALNLDPKKVRESYSCELSGGQLQRAMLSIALFTKPKVLIADEPTSALDTENVRGAIDAFRKLLELSGTALLFVSHDLGAVQALCERVLVMQKGKRVSYGTADLLVHPEDPYTAYLAGTRGDMEKAFRRCFEGRLAP